MQKREKTGSEQASIARVRRRAPNVAANLGPDLARSGLPARRIALDSDELFWPAAFLALTLGHDVKPLGRGEKIAWELPFAFKGVPCSIALEKFGLRLYIGAPKGDSIQHVELLAELKAAAAEVERSWLKPLATEKLKAGEVTIINRAAFLRGMYEFFRKHAEKARPDRHSSGSSQDLGEVLNAVFQHTQATSYNAVAAVTAFFSWLEHVLVIAYALVTTAEPSDILDVMQARWRDKFKSLFNLATDPQASSVYTKLLAISDDYRNPYDHGLVGPKWGTVYVHVPTLGAIPATLSEHSRTPHLHAWVPFIDSPTSMFGVFDEVERLLSGRSPGAERFISSSLNLSLAKETLTEVRQAINDAEMLEELIQTWSYFVDQATNMDW